MSVWFVLSAMLAQFLYWPSAVVGVFVGLFSRSWRLLVPLALLATFLDLALMVATNDDPSFGLKSIRENLAFFVGTTLVGALGHVAIGTWLRRRNTEKSRK